jgi:hypothetical protein
MLHKILKMLYLVNAAVSLDGISRDCHAGTAQKVGGGEGFFKPSSLEGSGCEASVLSPYWELAATTTAPIAQQAKPG